MSLIPLLIRQMTMGRMTTAAGLWLCVPCPSFRHLPHQVNASCRSFDAVSQVLQRRCFPFRHLTLPCSATVDAMFFSDEASELAFIDEQAAKNDWAGAAHWKFKYPKSKKVGIFVQLTLKKCPLN